jgi:hypothetical protein
VKQDYIRLAVLLVIIFAVSGCIFQEAPSSTQQTPEQKNETQKVPANIEVSDIVNLKG